MLATLHLLIEVPWVRIPPGPRTNNSIQTLFVKISPVYGLPGISLNTLCGPGDRIP